MSLYPSQKSGFRISPKFNFIGVLFVKNIFVVVKIMGYFLNQNSSFSYPSFSSSSKSCSDIDISVQSFSIDI